MKTKFLILISLALLTMLTACNFLQDKNKNTMTISGVVTDNDNYPLQGVKVTVNGNNFTTSETGSFLFDDLEVSKEKIIVNFKKDGYFSNSVVISEPQEINQIQTALMPKGNTKNGFGAGSKIPVSQGGELKISDGSALILPQGSIKSNETNVNAYFSFIPSDDYSFGNLVPGENLKGLNRDGEDIMLYAYGLMFIELSDSRGTVQLKKDASIKVAIPYQDIDYMPDNMEMYSFNETSGLWEYESIAKKEGSYYIAKTDHFSSWALGMPENSIGFVKGRVIDRSGRPIKGQNVKVFQTTAVTDNDGYYKAKVPAGKNFVVGMNYKGFEIKMDAGPLKDKEEIVLDISVPSMTMISGTIIGCDDKNTAGQANLTWGEPEFSNMYTKDGKFELSIPTVVKDSKLKISIGDSFIVKEISNPDKKTEINVGEIKLCVKEKEDKEQNKEKEDDRSDRDNKKQDNSKDKENIKPKSVNVVGVYEFVSRSDGQRLVNYHRFTINADGTYQEDYNPINSGNYVGGTKGTWKLSGNILTFTYVSGGGESYTVEGNTMYRKTDDGITFKFQKTQ
ncbi:MAG: carboxypeptidase regulatory-like domain-containing protein [Bacteroidales bacterium]|nr:carboxypeptidase regulatory-like domain-containing protein [Bacteroidales bacterium]